MSDLITALLNIKKFKVTDVFLEYKNKNRINSMGDGFERYIQDAFAGSFYVDEKERNNLISKCFSYIGNSNNPPDMMLINSDAIEAKKVTSYRAGIALNSSHPKDKIYQSDPKLTRSCKECENWNVKDIIYAIGVAPDSKKLSSLFFVYGDCIAAEKEVYERITNTISSGVTSIQGVDFTITNELGKVKKVDPLGITDLRIRGMWHIENPYKVFDYLDEFDTNAESYIYVLMQEKKFNSFPREIIEKLQIIDGIRIIDVKIKDPNNPAVLLDAKYIKIKMT